MLTLLDSHNLLVDFCMLSTDVLPNIPQMNYCTS